MKKNLDLNIVPSFPRVDDYIAIIRGGLPVELCEEITKDIETRPWRKHQWGYYNTKVIRSEKTLEPQVQDITEELSIKLRPFIERALNLYQDKYAVHGEKCGSRWLSSLSSLRFNKYPVGSKMRKHYDHIHSLFDGKRKGIPIISIVGSLNEDYEGAEFMLRDKEVKLNTGDILLFPSVFLFYHSVEEPKKGTRYSFVCWAY